jgi:glycosyltransferase involved in cell wall biosynthesis
MGDDLIGENRVNGSYTLFGNLLVFINKWFAKKKYKTIIVKSTQMQKLIANSNCIVLPNGVDFERFYPVDKHEAKKKLGVRAQENIILFVSDPNRPEKNFKLAEKAHALLNDSSCKLQVVNRVSPESLNLYYNVADVCLLTSFHEGSPNVIKEAMACNCPIVSTEVGDVKEVIGSTKGCYITPFEPKEVAEKLKTALSFGKRTNGRQNIQHFECSVIAEKLINLYKRCIKG